MGVAIKIGAGGRDSVERFIAELVASLWGWRPLVEEPGVEELGVCVVAAEWAGGCGVKFFPCFLNGVWAVRFGDESYDAGGVPVDGAVEAMAPL